MERSKMNGQTNRRRRLPLSGIVTEIRDAQHSGTAPINGSPWKFGLFPRFGILSVFLILGFLALGYKLWFLQIYMVDIYSERALRNTQRHTRIAAPRGDIVDAKGQVVATTTSKFVVSIVRGGLPKVTLKGKKTGGFDERDTLVRLAQAAETDVESLLKFYSAHTTTPTYEPMPIITNVTQRIATRVLENLDAMPGVIVQVVPMRRYPNGHLMTSVIGYTSPVTSEDMLDTSIKQRYRATDFIGRSGVERTYDGILAGKPGDEPFTTDRTNNERQTSSGVAPQPGKTLHLTIDAQLQGLITKALGKAKGAVIAIEPQTGRVLAMVSAPSYNLNLWNNRPMAKGTYKSGILPFAQNNCLQAQLPPGSVMKIVTLTAALESGKVTENTRVQCNGGLTIGKKSRLGCTGNHGYISMHQAFAVSCNAYFGQIGIFVGQAGLEKWARFFGLGSTSGIDLPSERDGNIDGPVAQTAIYRHYKLVYPGWFSGDSANMAIGQGAMLTTPMQVAVMASIVANDGVYVKPRVMDYVTDNEMLTRPTMAPESAPRQPSIPWSDKTRNLVQSAMLGVTETLRGTGHAVRLPGIHIHAKSGSAESKGKRSPTHAWFAGYASRYNEKPKVAFAIWLDAGGKFLHGGSDAAPIAKVIVKHVYGIQTKLVSIDATVR